MRVVVSIDPNRRLVVVVEAAAEPDVVQTTGVELKPGLVRCETKRRDSGVVELNARRRAG